MFSLKKNARFIGVVFRVLRENPVRSVLLIVGYGLSSLLQVISVGAIYPIVVSVVQKERAENQMMAILDRALAALQLAPTTSNYVLVFAILYVASTVLFVLFGFLQGRFIERLQRREATRLLRLVLHAKWSVLSSESHGDLLFAVSRDSVQLVKVVRYALMMISDLIAIALFSCCLILFSWQLFLLAVCLCSGSVLVFFPIFRFSHHAGVRATTASVRLNENVLNVTRSLKNMKAGSLEKPAIRFIQPFLERCANSYFRQGLAFIMQSKVSELTGAAILGILFFIGIRFYSLSLPELAIFFFILSRIIPKYRTVSTSYNTAVAHLPSVERIVNLEERCREKTRLSGAAVASVETITCRSLSFGYDPNCPIIRNLNIEFRKGCFYAIAGATGSGKTTLLDLFVGILEPTSGNVYYNGIPLQKIDLRSAHKRIGYITQDSFVFAGSLLDNFSWGNEQLDLSRMDAALQLAQLKDFVGENGLDYRLVESGQNVSGGQKQRIALTRTFLQEYDFILMDEPSSDLDDETERRFLAELSVLKEHIGIIMITHRKEFLSYTDFILEPSGRDAGIWNMRETHASD